MKNKFIYLAVLAAGFASCEPEFDNPVSTDDYSAGEADFSTYVAIGNSLTAGYMDGTVYKSGQANSFPNLLAKQFSVVGGGAFTQPSYDDDINNYGGLTLGGVPIASTRLVIDAAEGRPENITGNSSIEVSNLQATAYNNMGIPGAKSFHLGVAGYGNLAGVALGQANPYFVRHATSPTATVLGDAMSKNPTFFTNWIGNNDVLSYSTNGGAASSTNVYDNTPAADHNNTSNLDPTTYGGNDITNSNVFESVYSTLINTLTSGGAKGVVATIPNVTSIPYFTTVPYAPLTAQGLGKALTPPGSDVATQIAAGTTAMAQLNAQLYALLDGVFTAGGEPDRVNVLDPNTANPVLIYDVDAADRSAQISGYLQSVLSYPAATANAFGAIFGKARQTTSEDLIVLPASSFIGSTNVNAPVDINKNGISYPLGNRWVLSPQEQAKVKAATDAYNSTIKAIALDKDLAVADMNAILNQLVSGLRADNGTIYTANYFGSGTTEFKVLFSLDGVHPNARGYSVIANEIIKVINSHYKSKLPLLNPNNYPGIHIVPMN
ncbi:G-D-S-L family lipolytic protein [Flavobacterium sp. J27]|uniref:G-D-S-L family lipolytic protein n=1 Tax=Flavobacterium sp. J27 TaxID=2060419 RepID=UPI0010307E3B|nr:G-D-S-L family lipolytic protein [Flavobacterium sp. J27]